MLHGGKPSAEKKDKSLRMDALQGHRARPGPLGSLCTMQRKNYIDDVKAKGKQRTAITSAFDVQNNGKIEHCFCKIFL